MHKIGQKLHLCICTSLFQAKYSRKRKIAEASFIAALDGEGQVPHNQDQFVNEMHPLDQQASASTASAKCKF